MIFDINNCTEQDKKDFFNFWQSAMEGHIFHTHSGEYCIKELVSVTAKDKDTGAEITIYGDNEGGDNNADNNS